MSEPDLRIPPSLRNKVLGKLFLVVLLSIGLGFAMTSSFAADYELGSALTLEEYTANYDEYRAGLIGTEQWPAWGWIMICFLLLGGVVLAYEAAGSGIAWLVGRAWLAAPRGEVDRAEGSSDRTA